MLLTFACMGIYRYTPNANIHTGLFYKLREAAKKENLLRAGPLRPNPPPSSLMAVERWNVGKKVIFFLNGPARPLREDLFVLFCGFP